VTKCHSHLTDGTMLRSNFHRMTRLRSLRPLNLSVNTPRLLRSTKNTSNVGTSIGAQFPFQIPSTLDYLSKSVVPFVIIPISIITMAEDRILKALFVQHQVYDKEEVDGKEIASTADVPMSTFTPLVSRMITKKGLLERGSCKGMIKLSKQGMEMASNLVDPDDLVSTNAQIHEQIRNKLKGKPLEVFNILADGEEHEKSDIMEAINCTNKSTFAPMMSRTLAKGGFVEYPTPKTVRLNREKCFPFKK
jgi:hypothetical protein